MRKLLILLAFVTVIVIVLVVVSWFSLENNSTNGEVDLLVTDFIPQQKMIKVFNGGFENSGMIHVIDSIEQGFYQVKQLDTGAGMIFVYRVSEEDIRMVYSEQNETDILERNALAMEPTRDDIFIKGPIKKGTKWKKDQGTYEITGVNVKVSTPAGAFDTIEITFQENDYSLKQYYAKEIGLVKTCNTIGESLLVKIDVNLDQYKTLGDLFKLLPN